MKYDTMKSSIRYTFAVGSMVLAGLMAAGCQKKAPAPEAVKAPPPPAPVLALAQSPYGVTPDGDSITLYTLTDGKGMEVKLINYGATVVGIKAPDKNGVYENVTLGYDDLPGYVGCKDYLGNSIGRYANRIGKAQFKLDGKMYNVTKNDGDNLLHGGAKGFHKRIWTAVPFSTPDSVGVTFTYLAKDGEEGFPGNLSVTNYYALKADQSLTNCYTATTDKNTVVNLTNHSYFNLVGEAKRDILGHELMIPADNMTPVGKGLIPTGEIKPVKGTPFDFTASKAIGARIDSVAGGYDHNWIVNRTGTGVELMASVYEPTSGRVMEIFSTEPAIQFYSGNFLNGTIVGRGGKTYPKYYAFCLEPQHYPDSPNKPQFPTTLLKPGETYRNVMIYKFSAK